MNNFMDFYITPKGSLYSAVCDKCGRKLFVHEWADCDPNEARDAMQKGALPCPDCNGHADPSTFRHLGLNWYAARYSANGYLDCTEWEFDTNARRLEREIKRQYA